MTGTDWQVIDRAIGCRVRRRRCELGLTQSELARALGVSSQEIQEYERGAARICAATLFAATHVLQASPAYFLQDLQLRGAS